MVFISLLLLHFWVAPMAPMAPILGLKSSDISWEFGNGWYSNGCLVVKIFFRYLLRTLDNGESVRLQYRSLKACTPDTSSNGVNEQPTQPQTVVEMTSWWWHCSDNRILFFFTLDQWLNSPSLLTWPTLFLYIEKSCHDSAFESFGLGGKWEGCTKLTYLYAFKIHHLKKVVSHTCNNL